MKKIFFLSLLFLLSCTERKTTVIFHIADANNLIDLEGVQVEVLDCEDCVGVTDVDGDCFIKVPSNHQNFKYILSKQGYNRYISSIVDEDFWKQRIIGEQLIKK